MVLKIYFLLIANNQKRRGVSYPNGRQLNTLQGQVIGMKQYYQIIYIQQFPNKSKILNIFLIYL